MTKAIIVGACLLLMCSGAANAQRADYFGTTEPSTIQGEKAQTAVPTPPRTQLGGVPGCSTTCPPGGISEGEPDCGDGYVDVTNGGCNSTPPVFTSLLCAEPTLEVCGTYGTYQPDSSPTRDTDWYQFTIDQEKALQVCVCGSVPTQLAILNASCDPISLVCGSVFGIAGEQICCNPILPAGTYWIFVSTDGFSGFPCASPYLLSITGLDCGTVGTEASHWSQVKSMYR